MGTVQLAHGSGGIESAKLIKDIFFDYFGNSDLNLAEDATPIYNGKLAVSTDGYSVTPLFFAGGDIGTLAVCGSCNDVAMMGAKPKWLTLGCFIEEGFETAKLKKLAESIGKKCREIDINIVSGDTKVLPKGAVDGIYLHTTAVGEIALSGLSCTKLQVGDTILVSRDVGTHGAAIFSARDGINLESSVKSDCAHLWPTVEKLINAKLEIVAMRDATRGGLAAVLNEWSISSEIEITAFEDKISISREVSGICELLGFEAWNLANEGTFVLCVRSNEDKALQILKEFNVNAEIIGKVTEG
ncbi:MAG: hydrogenase expression/formation protein HypE, partial [Pseudomonadota bacterium]